MVACRYSHMDLLYTFLKWSPTGLYSSIIFLEYLDPEYFECMEDRFWKLSAFGMQRCNSQKLFKILGMDYKEPLKSPPYLDPKREKKPDGTRKKR